MLKLDFIKKIIVSRNEKKQLNKKKKALRGGQFICFEQEQEVGKLSWTKCECSLENICDKIRQDTNEVPGSPLNKKPTKREDRSESTPSTTDLTLGSSSGFFTLEDASQETEPQQGLALTRLYNNDNDCCDDNNNNNKVRAWMDRHALVNRQRGALFQLRRSAELDELARDQAEAMAKESRVFHSDPNALCARLNELPPRRLGESCVKGANRSRLDRAMTELASDYAILTDPRFTSMGLAVARDAKGVSYQCILLQG